MVAKFYLELHVQLLLGQEDLWSDFCFGKNALGIEIITETKTAVNMRVFFEEQEFEDVQTFPEQFCKLFHFPSNTITLLQLDLHPYEDWQNNWKQYFLPIDVGQSFTICPPWKISETSTEKTSIIIDPGQGFGTGYHPSTILALETLEHLVLQSPQKFISLADIGTGSGILAFAAAYLGIPLIYGIDQDIAAVRDVLKNREFNGLEKIVHPVAGRPDCLRGQCSLVVSNMLLHELTYVSQDLVRLVAPSGNLICSGFLENQWLVLQETFHKLGMFSIYLSQKENWRATIFAHLPK